MVFEVVDHEESGPSFRDSAWFDQMFSEHAAAVHRYFVRRSAIDDVDDLVAEVFTTAWRRRDKIPHDMVLPWLYRTAGYLLANHRRKPVLTLIGEYGEQRAGRSADPAEILVEDDELREALSHLSPRDRNILMLHAWEGLDGEALGRALGISRGGAAAALSRARSRLREAWEER